MRVETISINLSQKDPALRVDKTCVGGLLSV